MIKRALSVIIAAFAAMVFFSGNSSAAVVPNNPDYVVFAWNDLGMHCLNPTYDSAVILPPYNTLVAQVVKRGNPPQVVTAGLTVEYRLINNTYSYGKRNYAQFWQNAGTLFGASGLPINTGLNLVDPAIHNGLSGTMVVHGTSFEANGIPVVPVDDAGTWNPYQVAEITVKDQSGNIVAVTETTVPTSDEINCAKCHGPDALNDILVKHDQNIGTSLAGKPVLCAGCHASPALGVMMPSNGAKGYLSAAIHGFHATKGAACYDCHPGATTQCSRSLAHTAPDGNCTTCHGDLAYMTKSIVKKKRIPWLMEPKCVACHKGVAGVDTKKVLYRNSIGHGGMRCSACHGSPHAMVPSREASDNYQAMQYQGAVRTIGSCAVCHDNSRGGGGPADFSEEHGGAVSGERSACNVCHTGFISSNAKLWPHSFKWKARPNSNPSVGGN